MNALVKKEVRLLLPSWSAVLSLAILVPWLFAFAGGDLDTSFIWTPVVLFFSLILLAVDVFGREFSLGTYAGLMAQPVARTRIWRVKMTVLFLAAGSVLLVYFAGSGLVFHRALRESIWAANPKILGADYHHALLGGVAAAGIALAGGLWTTLLFRQISAAFWITFLAPLGGMMLVIFFVPARAGDAVIIPLLIVLAVIYCLAGFWLAHRLFHRSQDVGWSGGVISFSTWRYLDVGKRDGRSTRIRKPLAALIKKEFQLHSISLFCAGALLALHLAVMVMRYVHGRFVMDSFPGVISEFFWIFWLVMPLVIGCMAVAEERRLGVTNEQFCLPVSRRWQFIIKFIPVMLAGVGLGAVMPLVLEGIATLAGAPTDLFKAQFNPQIGSPFLSDDIWFVLVVMALALGFTLAGFMASTLAKNFLHALSIAIVICVAAFFFFTFMASSHTFGNGFRLVGAKWWGLWPIFIGIIIILMVVPWLAWRNFNQFTETGRLWRRNLLGVILALVFVFASSAFLYNRTWELFEPVEPAHGLAKFSLANPPVLQRVLWAGLSVRLPDGRVWFDYLDEYPDAYETAGLPNHWAMIWAVLTHPLPTSHGPRQFMAGANWISMTIPRPTQWNQANDGGHVRGYLNNVGVQPDGSLWVSRSGQAGWTITNEMVRFGEETNWQQVAASLDPYFLLLKTDGTLWQWDRSLKKSPEQIGRSSDWEKIYSNWRFFVQDKQGDVWRVEFKDKTNAMLNIDGSFLFENDLVAQIHTNGTLWINDGLWDKGGNFQPGKYRLRQVGQATDWVRVAICQGGAMTMVALKTDGSLWQWKNLRDMPDIVSVPPVRLGTHHDWISLVSTWDGIVSLAADGSLWFWPGADYNAPLFRATRQPRRLASVFAGAK